MALPVAGYYRVSRARDEMRAPELYDELITSCCSYRKLTVRVTWPNSVSS